MTTTKPNLTSASSRLPFRNRNLVIVAAAAATIAAVTFKSKSEAIKNNDLAQRNTNPTGYVSVDRSGGGV